MTIDSSSLSESIQIQLFDQSVETMFQGWKRTGYHETFSKMVVGKQASRPAGEEARAVALDDSCPSQFVSRFDGKD